jgi:alpha-D-ribose 1-methylphosphonate 5-triphosphate synthase subunit PhnH
MSTRISAGFEQPVHDSQAAFRAALEALSRPGRVQDVVSPLEAPAAIGSATYALLLTLADHQTPVWLPPTEQALADSLRFHTGCPVVDTPGAAAFALVHAGSGPELAAFAAGDDETPERSTTLIIEVESLIEGPAHRLTGPGIAQAHTLHCPALDEHFLIQWDANRMRFPAGVDVFLTAGEQLLGLPRTTRIES